MPRILRSSPQSSFLYCLIAGLIWSCASTQPTHTPIDGWLNWRGPNQDGSSPERDLPEDLSVGGSEHLWTYPLAGRGTPVIAGNKLYTFGYRGDGPDLKEVLACLNRETGELIWEHAFNDFLSDIIYERYSIGSPTIDPETGQVYLMTSAGLVSAFSGAGKLIWQHSMMEEFGRLTFPNGRTGAPLIFRDLVIVRGITTSWGHLGPARDRFYAFHKMTGDLIWISTPGVRPIDSSFSFPVVTQYQGRDIFVSGTGCGNLVAVDLLSGRPLWRFQMARGGVNSTPLVEGERVTAIHGKENLDTSRNGRMVSIDPKGAYPEKGAKDGVVLTRENEAWRADLGHFTSSGVRKGRAIYQMLPTGELLAVNADTGSILWRKKLGNEQLHASPLFADGKLYIPLRDCRVHVLYPEEKSVREISSTQLKGSCLGSPAVFRGQIFIHSTEGLYAFGKPRASAPAPLLKPVPKSHDSRTPKGIRVQPAELLLHAGTAQPISVWQTDEHGAPIKALKPGEWHLGEEFSALKKDMSGAITADTDASIQAGTLKINSSGFSAGVRVRVFPKLPYHENFDRIQLGPHPQKPGVLFAHPPNPWIGAKLKWEVREHEGNKMLRKTLDRLLFQRATTFIGPHDLKSYTLQADVMSEGNRRGMSTVGLINQRYIIALKGNWQQLEVSSNFDRIQVGVPFEWKVGVWYHLKTRVDIAKDGSGVVRAKAWEKGTPEPDAWTIEVPHKRAHRNGAPGLFGFSPQAQFPVYLDNVWIQQND